MQVFVLGSPLLGEVIPKIRHNFPKGGPRRSISDFQGGISGWVLSRRARVCDLKAGFGTRDAGFSLDLGGWVLSGFWPW